MTHDDHDPLAADLAALTAEAPSGLLDRVTARWVQVPAPIGDLGDLKVAFTDRGIAYVRPADEEFASAFRARFERPLLPSREPPIGLTHALRTGQVGELRFDLRGLSPFQEEVLQAARTIPRGEVRPYAWVAREIGRPRAVRAVGSALAGNPVPLLIPCHRVTRADGAVGNYVFGETAKVELLRLEGVDPDRL